MFQWNWNDIAIECERFLGPSGYGAVQISPPQASRVTTAWWGVYQPVNFKSFTSRFGNEAQLRSMIGRCHAAGVRVYADVVVNQMSAGDSSTAGVATDGSSWSASALRYPRFSAADFHEPCVIGPGDYSSASGRASVQQCRLSTMPDLNSESEYVRSEIAAYLRTLLDMGVDGFRIDAAKHQRAGSLHAIMASVKATHPRTSVGEDIWITQEIIPDAAVPRADYLPIGTVNEFRYTYLMRDVWRNAGGASPASIPALMGTWNNWGGTRSVLPSEQATVFIANWDSEREGSSLTANDLTGDFPNDADASHRYHLANIFMLAQGYGEAQLFSGFRYGQKDQNRPSASPYVDGVPQINVSWDFLHRWPSIAPMVKFRSAAHGAPIRNWTQGTQNQIAFRRGTVGFVALNNSSGVWSQTFATGLPPGKYCSITSSSIDAAGTGCTSGSPITVDSAGDAFITVPADGDDVVPAVVIYQGQKLK